MFGECDADGNGWLEKSEVKVMLERIHLLIECKEKIEGGMGISAATFN